MSEVIIGRCEYCGAEHVPVIATPETDIYCIECHRLTRDNCNEAIRKIKEYQKIHKGKRVRTKKNLTELKADAEEALSALAGQTISLND